MAYVLAVCTALANALSSILSRLGVEDAPADHSMRLRLIAYAVRRKVWLVGFVVMVGAFVLQASALHAGNLSTVQPILTLELPFLVAILGFWFHKRLTWREWAGAFAAAGGLAAFLALASPANGRASPDLDTWGKVSFSVLALSALFAGLAHFGPPAWKAASLGIAAAVMFAFTAALIKQTTEDLSPWYGVVRHWEPWAMAASGLVALFLTQNAFHAGPVTASQATLVTVDPIASIIVGVALFGENIDTARARGVLEVLALALLCAGAYFLSRSPLVAHVRSEDQAALGERDAETSAADAADAPPDAALGMG